ncbi:hypothetical protein ABRY23_06045 [Melioribacteraceae bacterium 4301-Me]|uniref:hypothetical protein n=1 Tax=Pyranulibacter aquaticus TaxID=3163344 RepID=UPI00359801E6
MFFNLQIATNPNSNGDIDLFGLKISLFMPSVYATGGSNGYGKWVYYPSHGLCRFEPISLGDRWECTGLWSWTVCSPQ